MASGLRLSLQAIGEIGNGAQQGLVSTRRSVVGGDAATNPDPCRRLIEEAVGDQHGTGKRLNQVALGSLLRAQLNAEHWSAIFGNTEFCKEVFVAPFQQAAIRLAQTVAKWWREMCPDDQDSTRSGIVNQREAQATATLSVKFQVPYRCIIATVRLGHCDTVSFKQRRNCCDL